MDQLNIKSMLDEDNLSITVSRESAPSAENLVSGVSSDSGGRASCFLITSQTFCTVSGCACIICKFFCTKIGEVIFRFVQVLKGKDYVAGSQTYCIDAETRGSQRRKAPPGPSHRNCPQTWSCLHVLSIQINKLIKFLTAKLKVFYWPSGHCITYKIIIQNIKVD